MNLLPFTWVFRLKDVATGIPLRKARCCDCGDYQEPFFELDPDTTYALVASQEAFRLLLSYAASNNLIVEGSTSRMCASKRGRDLNKREIMGIILRGHSTILGVSEVKCRYPRILPPFRPEIHKLGGDRRRYEVRLQFSDFAR